MSNSLWHQGTIWSWECSTSEYRNGLPFPSPGDLPNPGIKPRSPTLQADSLSAEPPGKPWKELSFTNHLLILIPKGKIPSSYQDNFHSIISAKDTEQAVSSFAAYVLQIKGYAKSGVSLPVFSSQLCHTLAVKSLGKTPRLHLKMRMRAPNSFELVKE